MEDFETETSFISDVKLDFSTCKTKEHAAIVFDEETERLELHRTLHMNHAVRYGISIGKCAELKRLFLEDGK